MKRTLDIVAASCLLVGLLPIALLTAVVLAVTGDREIIYRQTRVGRSGRGFKILKFATMRGTSRDAGDGHLTLPGDPRVLPFGRFLRKTKLNELPQLVNVIKGDMSLVGPRPQPPEIFAYYPDDAKAVINSVRPGITGVGAVVFRDEERLLQESPLPPAQCHREVFAPRKAQLETWYVRNRRLSLDLWLLVLTVIALVAPGSRLYEFGISSLRLPTGAPQPGDERPASTGSTLPTSERRGISRSRDARTPAPGR